MQLYSLFARLSLSVFLSSFLVAASPLGFTNKGNNTVIAHYVLGNTFPYTVDDWKYAIYLAQSYGIDAFALDLGKDDWEPAKVADAYKAAIGTNFCLYLMFDMASLRCDTAEDGNFIRLLVNAYYEHSNQLRYNGSPVVGTFGGQLCRFGTDRMDDGWTNVLKRDMRPVHFLPAFFIETPIYEGLNCNDGAFSWDSAWPANNADINSEYDDEHLRYLKGKTYMAGVSPWFFTHYGRDSFNKNFVYRGDDWLLVERWEQLVKTRRSIPFAQIISWNDYGESHYVGPINGAQPKSESWTTGFDHQGWLDLMRYYIHGYKTGWYPEITKDRAFLWGRLYPAKADAPDPIGKPTNYDWMQDSVWGIVMLPRPARIQLECGSSRLSTDLDAGVNKIQLPLVEDCSVRILVIRDGVTTIDFAPSGYHFKTSPSTYNFNAFVAASPA